MQKSLTELSFVEVLKNTDPDKVSTWIQAFLKSIDRNTAYALISRWAKESNNRTVEADQISIDIICNTRLVMLKHLDKEYFCNIPHKYDIPQLLDVCYTNDRLDRFPSLHEISNFLDIADLYTRYAGNNIYLSEIPSLDGCIEVGAFDLFVVVSYRRLPTTVTYFKKDKNIAVNIRIWMHKK